MKMSDQMFIELMALGLRLEGAKSMDDGSEKAKEALTTFYLAKYQWDIEITFNMREIRDAGKNPLAARALLVNELYSQAEAEFGAAINAQLDSLQQRGVMRA